MKIYFDDIRLPTDTYEKDDWVLVRTDIEFKQMVMDRFESIEFISFDHDINCFENGREVTGYDCLKWLCEFIIDVDVDIHFDITSHSANPCGNKNITEYWKNFKENYPLR